jgi:glutamine amidotransferase-like uncharacterized protein
MTAGGRPSIAWILPLVVTAASVCDWRSNPPLKSPADAPILLFNGRGTSPEDVAAVEAILDGSHLGYSLVSSSQLNAMTAAQLRSYRLLIVPGGNFEAIGKNLTPRAFVNVHDAVEDGLSYLGICAGAFLAGSSTHYRSLGLAGVQFPFYADENRGIRKAAVVVAGPGTPTLEQYWEDGPQLGGWGCVVGRYPDGTPAIVEGPFGEGWVVLTGVHPEAPASWRRELTFTTPVEADHAYAATLVRAALDRTRLAHD